MLSSKNKISLANDLANMMRNIYLTQFLDFEEKCWTIDNNLINEFNDTKKPKIDLVDGRIDFNECQVVLIKMTVDCTEK